MVKNVKLKRTGVTKTKVDGYYWSRVIYNNQVVYVASNYLKLVEKPTESSEEKTPEIDPDKPTVPENPDETLSGEKDGTDQSGNSNDEA